MTFILESLNTNIEDSIPYPWKKNDKYPVSVKSLHKVSKGAKIRKQALVDKRVCDFQYNQCTCLM